MLKTGLKVVTEWNMYIRNWSWASWTFKEHFAFMSPIGDTDAPVMGKAPLKRR